MCVSSLRSVVSTHLFILISVPLYMYCTCVFVCISVSLRPEDLGVNVRVCINMWVCFSLLSLSQDEQSHPSSVLSNGGSGWLTLGPLIRPHLVGISLRARHSSCDTERNPDYPPLLHLPSSPLFLFSSSFSSLLSLSLSLSDRNKQNTQVCTHFLPLSASQLSTPQPQENEDKLV